MGDEGVCFVRSIDGLYVQLASVYWYECVGMCECVCVRKCVCTLIVMLCVVCKLVPVFVRVKEK